MKNEIGRGPPGLGILLSKGPASDPHEGHDDKHAMCARIAELLGAKLSSSEEGELCDALAAFMDAHDAEEKKEEADEEGSEAGDGMGDE